MLEQSIHNAPSLACPDYFQLISSSYGLRMLSENFFSPKIYLKAELESALLIQYLTYYLIVQHVVIHLM